MLEICASLELSEVGVCAERRLVAGSFACLCWRLAGLFVMYVHVKETTDM